MKVGNREILKPMDDGCDELWVDFNLVPKVIRVYCQKHPSVDMDIKWDSMAIEASDIGRFDIDRLQGKKIAINVSDAASGWAGWALAHPAFGVSVKPIPIKGADFANRITACPPEFENLAASLNVLGSASALIWMNQIWNIEHLF